MSIIKFIADHHSGGVKDNPYAKTQHLNANHINQSHKDRWQFISTLGYYGGYNFYIEADGKYTQFRAIGEETAAQLGYNLNCISFCLAGNFTLKDGKRVEEPTPEQLNTRTLLIKKILNKDYLGIKIAPNTVIDVKIDSIHPHSFYQSTNCNCYPDGWGRKLILDEEITSRQNSIISIIDSIILLLNKLKVEIVESFKEKKVGAIDRSCDGTV